MTLQTPIAELSPRVARRRRRSLAQVIEARLVVALGQRLALAPLDVTLSDGATLQLGDQTAPTTAALRLNRPRALRRLITGGAIGFAEAYVEGDWDSLELGALLTLLARAQGASATCFAGHPLARLTNALTHRRRRNSRVGSRRNIQRHYDLGNDFFAHWLDRGMSYSAALFEDERRSLEAAQDAKLARVATLLEPSAHDRVLEIGCGWGGLAGHLAREFGCHVDAITVSRAQYEFGRTRIADAGLDGRVDVRLIDYRDVTGRYDRIVSIEMLEAVGEAYWPLYFRRLDELLSADGCVVLQAIVIAESHYAAYRRQPDFIQRHIFPGGMLPTVPIIEALAAARGFTIDQLSFHGADYAETLRHWRARFEAAAVALDRLGYGERFRRLWRYYLAYCEAGFETERIDVVQIRLRRRGSVS